MPSWIAVVLYTLFASLASAILFGLAPALQATRAGLVPALKSGPGSGQAPSLSGPEHAGDRTGGGSLLLLVAPPNFSGRFASALRPTRFRGDHLLMANFDPSLVRYTEARPRRSTSGWRNGPGRFRA